MQGLPEDTINMFKNEWNRAEAAGAVRETPLTAVKNFYLGIAAAYEQLELEIRAGIRGPDRQSYSGLERILKVSASAYANEPELPLRG